MPHSPTPPKTHLHEHDKLLIVQAAVAVKVGQGEQARPQLRLQGARRGGRRRHLQPAGVLGGRAVAAVCRQQVVPAALGQGPRPRLDVKVGGEVNLTPALQEREGVMRFQAGIFPSFRRDWQVQLPGTALVDSSSTLHRVKPPSTHISYLQEVVERALVLAATVDRDPRQRRAGALQHKVAAGLPCQAHILVGRGPYARRGQCLAADGEHGKVGAVPADLQELRAVQGQLQQAWSGRGGGRNVSSRNENGPNRGHERCISV